MVEEGVLARNGTVVGVVLDVHANRGLRQAVDNGELPGRALGDPQILQEKVKADITGSAKEISRGGKLSSTTDNLEDLTLDFLFKGSIKLVPEKY